MAYEMYLDSFGVVKKPAMPKFDLSAYTDNEYISAINELLKDYDGLDDEYLILKHLKGV